MDICLEIYFRVLSVYGTVWKIEREEVIDERGKIIVFGIGDSRSSDDVVLQP